MGETHQELTVTFTPTADDHIRWKWLILRRGNVFLWAGIFVCILLSPGAMIALARVGELEPKDWLSGVLFLVLFSLLLFVYFPWSFRRRIRKAYRNNPNAQRETTYRFTSRGIASSTAVGRSEAAWEAVTEVVETKEDFLFFFSRLSAYVVPKDAFSSPDERQQLRRIVMSFAGDRAKLWPDEDEVQSKLES